MFITLFQLGTVICLCLWVLAACFLLIKENISCGNPEEVFWILKSQRMGRARQSLRYRLLGDAYFNNEIGLAEERYILGNGMSDDIYMDVPGKRVRIYLNVQKEKVCLTVLKGHVKVRNHVITPDKTKVIELYDLSRVVLDEAELQFCRKKGL